MTRVWPTPAAINNLYMRVRARRPAWFRLSADIGMDDYGAFSDWVRAHLTWWYDLGDVIVPMCIDRHVAEIHPLFLGKVDMARLGGVLTDMATCGIRRVEVPLVWPGHTVRRILRQLGFQLEGILRNRERVKSGTVGEYTYMDVELWARLIEGDNDGKAE